MKLRNKKTGEIVELQNITLFSHPTGNWNGSYKSLAELNNRFEDYKPAEPLIKDEKIRKAVRAWAEVNGIYDVSYDAKGKRFGRFGFTIMFGYDFDRNDGLKDGRFYTIAELCGEEEE